MLYKETVDNSTLELIKKLQTKEYLQNFYLVGGTALSLQLGHRKSIDIDLFSNFNFDTQQLLEQISYEFQFKLFFSTANTLKGSINNIQIDILAHRYSYVGEPLIADSIFMLSLKDISAMKLNAISTNGQRVKDFIDIYYLLQKYKLKDLLEFYKLKYNQENEINVLKSLAYFDDVDLSDWPLMLKEPDLKWVTIKKKIIKEIEKYLNS